MSDRFSPPYESSRYKSYHYFSIFSSPKLPGYDFSICLSRAASTYRTYIIRPR